MTLETSQLYNNVKSVNGESKNVADILVTDPTFQLDMSGN